MRVRCPVPLSVIDTILIIGVEYKYEAPHYVLFASKYAVILKTFFCFKQQQLMVFKEWHCVLSFAQ
jgi:hypothetical protein